MGIFFSAGEGHAMGLMENGYAESRVEDPLLLAKYRRLKARLAGLGEAVIGFSGGVDSTLLAAVARQVLGRGKVLACLAVSPSLARREHQEALDLAERLDFELIAFDGTEFANPAYTRNGADRCFHCKTDLFVHLARIAAERGFSALLYGANADDGGDYRPGHRAAQERGGLAPLAEAGLTKAEVRALSRAFALPTADKPAAPCLSSRIPYGTAVTAERLSAVESGEALLKAMGFRECRLRHEGDTARLEVPLDQIGLFSDPSRVRELVAALKQRGFKRVVADLEGFRSGSLNGALTDEDRRRFAAR
jgi:pyridinium-3,5-biscarboxylic acid mononucleotide sulfurtransferase